MNTEHVSDHFRREDFQQTVTKTGQLQHRKYTSGNAEMRVCRLRIFSVCVCVFFWPEILRARPIGTPSVHSTPCCDCVGVLHRLPPPAPRGIGSE